MARPPLLLIPPSEGKAAGGRPLGRPDSFDAALGASRAVVLSELAQVLGTGGPTQHSSVLGVRGDLLDRALSATAELVAGTARVLPAWKRYTGVVWASLDPATLSAADRARVLVPSGLYGVTTSADPVADYRLKMLVSLGRLGRLSTFWLPEVTAAIARRAQGRVVVDLLPAEHAHAVDMVALAGSTRVIRAQFISADGRRAVGHEAKSAKGRLARTVLEGGLEAVGKFRFEGWRATMEGDALTVVAPST